MLSKMPTTQPKNLTTPGNHWRLRTGMWHWSHYLPGALHNEWVTNQCRCHRLTSTAMILDWGKLKPIRNYFPSLTCIWSLIHHRTPLAVVIKKCLALLLKTEYALLCKTIRPCVVCNPWVHNVVSCALQSSCTSNNSGLGMPSRRDDYYCQPVKVLKIWITIFIKKMERINSARQVETTKKSNK